VVQLTEFDRSVWSLHPEPATFAPISKLTLESSDSSSDSAIAVGEVTCASRRPGLVLFFDYSCRQEIVVLAVKGLYFVAEPERRCVHLDFKSLTGYINHAGNELLFR
jgi:hypothetical protein